MKSTFFALSSAAAIALVSAIPDHFQSVPSVLCTDPPVKTVTITKTVVVAPSGGYPNTGVPEQTSVYNTATVGGTSTSASTPCSNSPAQQTHKVDVGAFKTGDNATLFEFRPNNITANTGDVILFNMLGREHSVTQSEFKTPCIKSGPDAFDTGLKLNAANTSEAIVERFVVSTTKPLWFYCKQKVGTHCGKGMVFGVNPKSNDQMQQFIDQAKIQNGTATATTPPTPAQTVTVKVGGQGPKLEFEPPFLSSVAPGTVVRFDFLFKNHTLTESSRDSPCTKLGESAIDTNFQNVNENDNPGAKPFDLTVDSSTPRWFYCKQANHCGAGMVFALNTAESVFMQFQELAKLTGKSSSPPTTGAPEPPAAPPASYPMKRRVARVW